jgi:hypothetical protein
MDWQVTAYTVECSAVAEEVTIIVKNDWSVQCTGFAKYGTSREAGIELLKRSLEIKRNLECKGLQCSQISDYIQKLQSEEAPKPAGPDGEKRG